MLLKRHAITFYRKVHLQRQKKLAPDIKPGV
jgi:hypothetical protein